MKDLVLLRRKERVALDDWRLTLGKCVFMCLCSSAVGRAGLP